MSEVPLRDYLEASIQNLERYVESRLVSSDKAVTIALQTLNERLAGMNEFRDALKDQVATFANKGEVAASKAEVERRLSVIENARSRDDGKAAVYGGIAGLVSSILGAIVVFWVTR
jgi:hypothetical protein